MFGVCLVCGWGRGLGAIMRAYVRVCLAGTTVGVVTLSTVGGSAVFGPGMVCPGRKRRER